MKRFIGAIGFFFAMVLLLSGEGLYRKTSLNFLLLILGIFSAVAIYYLLTDKKSVKKTKK